MNTAQETTPALSDKAEDSCAGSSPKKPSRKSSSRRKRERPAQRSCDHLPIIIFLLVIFSLSLLCIGIGLTHYLDPERAAIPACGQAPCSWPLAPAVAQKGAGE